MNARRPLPCGAGVDLAKVSRRTKGSACFRGRRCKGTGLTRPSRERWGMNRAAPSRSAGLPRCCFRGVTPLLHNPGCRYLLSMGVKVCALRSASASSFLVLDFVWVFYSKNSHTHNTLCPPSTPISIPAFLATQLPPSYEADTHMDTLLNDERSVRLAPPVQKQRRHIEPGHAGEIVEAISPTGDRERRELHALEMHEFTVLKKPTPPPLGMIGGTTRYRRPSQYKQK